MVDERYDKATLSNRVEALEREINSLSIEHDLAPDVRKKIAALKLEHQELEARLRASERM